MAYGLVTFPREFPLGIRRACAVEADRQGIRTEATEDSLA